MKSTIKLALVFLVLIELFLIVVFLFSPVFVDTIEYKKGVYKLLQETNQSTIQAHQQALQKQNALAEQIKIGLLIAIVVDGVVIVWLYRKGVMK